MGLFDEDAEVFLKGAGGSVANVSTLGALSVSSGTQIPDGFVNTSRQLFGVLAGLTDESDVYTVPSGKLLVVTRFSCTAYAAASGDKATKFELWLDPNGNGVGMTLLRALVASNNGGEFLLEQPVTGDGTKAIRMIRESLDSQTRYAPCQWEGVVEV